MKIEDMPYPENRRYNRDKYGRLFSQLVPGQCLRVDPSEVRRVTMAMRRWLERIGRNDTLFVRSQIRSPDDGYGRVWLMRKSIKMADVPGRVFRNLGD